MTLTVRQEKMLKRRGFEIWEFEPELNKPVEIWDGSKCEWVETAEAMTECRRMNAREKQARYRRKKKGSL